MSKTKSISIRLIGLEKYLNDNAGIHNEQGYAQFAFYVDSRVSYNAIARMFSVDRNTVKKWADIYKEEQTNG